MADHSTIILFPLLFLVLVSGLVEDESSKCNTNEFFDLAVLSRPSGYKSQEWRKVKIFLGARIEVLCCKEFHGSAIFGHCAVALIYPRSKNFFTVVGII